MVDEEDFERVVKAMAAAERWHRQDMRNLLQGYAERDADLAIWRAMQRVQHDHGVVFGVMPGFPQTYRRLEPGQIVSQSRRQRRAGVRKMLRAATKLTLASAQTLDERERDRIEREASRTTERALYRARKVGGKI